ncbi:MAG: GPR1/FUN34/YaaH family transporter [Acidobacteria bacterium]|nr:GPR1/FUN34/YaaH family transporter [Acidobacteriota bacterium]
MPMEEINTNAPARIYLQPIAAPSILGLFGFAGATFMVAAHMAGWYGHAGSGLFLYPFAAVFGGIAQLLAAMWAFKARDGVATAVHGTWGAFWIAYGILNVMFATGKLAHPGSLFPELGYWFVVAAAITWMCTLAALAEKLSMFLVLLFLSIGSTLGAITYLTGNLVVMMASAYALIASSVLAWYAASALMFEEAFGHEIAWLRTGKTSRARESVVMVGIGEPGVVRGQ